MRKIALVLTIILLFQVGCQAKNNPPTPPEKQTLPVEERIKSIKPALQTTTSPLLTITAVGDVMLARGIEKKIAQYGVDYPFQIVSSLLSQADLSIANLECAVTDEGKPIGKSIILAASPQVLSGLKNSGIDAVSLANNHSFDHGSTGLLDTFSNLSESGIKYFGADANLNEAEKPLIMEIKGVKIALLGYNEFGPWANEKRSGTNRPTEERIKEQVSKAKNQADVVIVSIHGGVEKAQTPSKNIIAWSKTAIDSGALLVFNHHPHVLQGIESYKEGLIFYSLGNFVFDQPWHKHKQTVIVNLTIFEKKLLRCEIIPVYIFSGQPRVVSNTPEGNEICRFLIEASAKLDTRLIEAGGNLTLVNKFSAL